MTEKQKIIDYEEITSIRSVGVKETYDFQVPVTNCFVANDILIHNSGALEEDAWQAIILYNDPEDVIEAARSRIEVNTVKLLAQVAKNKRGPKGTASLRYLKDKQKMIVWMED